MLLVVRIPGKKYIKSVDTLDTVTITDIVSKLIHRDNMSNNIDSSELTIDGDYFIYETEYVDESDEREDEPIGAFWITNCTLLFEGDIVHDEF